MGHYAVDFQCDRCGHLRCCCAPVPDPDDDRWIVDDDFTVIKVCDFDKKHKYVQTKFGPIEGMPIARRYKRTHHDTKLEAAVEAEELLRQAIDTAATHHAELIALLADPPWKK